MGPKKEVRALGTLKLVSEAPYLSLVYVLSILLIQIILNENIVHVRSYHFLCKFLNFCSIFLKFFTEEWGLQNTTYGIQRMIWFLPVSHNLIRTRMFMLTIPIV